MSEKTGCLKRSHGAGWGKGRLLRSWVGALGESARTLGIRTRPHRLPTGLLCPRPPPPQGPRGLRCCGRAGPGDTARLRGGPAHWRCCPVAVATAGSRVQPRRAAGNVVATATAGRVPSGPGSLGTRVRSDSGAAAPRGTEPDPDVRPGRLGRPVGSSCIEAGFRIQHWKALSCVLQTGQLRPGWEKCREGLAPSQHVGVQAASCWPSQGTLLPALLIWL